MKKKLLKVNKQKVELLQIWAQIRIYLSSMLYNSQRTILRRTTHSPIMAMKFTVKLLLFLIKCSFLATGRSVTNINYTVIGVNNCNTSGHLLSRAYTYPYNSVVNKSIRITLNCIHHNTADKPVQLFGRKYVYNLRI